MRIKIGLVVSLFGALLLTGCASSTPAGTDRTTATAMATATPSLTVTPASSGKARAAKHAAGAKAKSKPTSKPAGLRITRGACKDLAKLEASALTRCPPRVKAGKHGLRATFTQRTAQYMISANADGF